MEPEVRVVLKIQGAAFSAEYGADGGLTLDVGDKRGSMQIGAQDLRGLGEALVALASRVTILRRATEEPTKSTRPTSGMYSQISGQIGARLLSILQQHSPGARITADTIIAAYKPIYNSHGGKLTRATALTYLAYAATQGWVRRIGRGIYRII